MHVLLKEWVQPSDDIVMEVRLLGYTVDLAVIFAGQRGRALPEASVRACACPCLAEWLQLLPQCLRVHTSSPLSINRQLCLLPHWNSPEESKDNDWGISTY